jgi:hypothetical protein
MPGWRCRCTQAQALPVDDGFSLRAIGCPLKLRKDGPEPCASVIHDCARCGFFVGIGYADQHRRRLALYCSFSSASRPRLGPVLARRPDEIDDAPAAAIAHDGVPWRSVAQ